MSNFFSKVSISLLLFAVVLLPPNLKSDDDEVTIPNDYSLFTSANFKGYTKPLFTTIGQGAQSNLFTTANYDEKWYISLDLSASSVLIPESQKTYDASLPDLFTNPERVDIAAYKDGEIIRNFDGIEQPTIYGGESTTIYAASPLNNENSEPSDSLYKTLSFMEGSDISTMASLPALQLMIGLPTQSEIRFRFLTFGSGNENISYLNLGLNQRVDRYLDLWDEKDSMALAVNIGYNTIGFGDVIDMNSISFGVHFSKDFGDNFSVYSGIQYENLSGDFYIEREGGYNSEFYFGDGETLRPRSSIDPDLRADYDEHVVKKMDVSESPFEEVRMLKPMEFSIESFTNFRILAGASYKVGIVEFHLDLGYASQPFLNGGISFRLGSWGGQERNRERGGN